MEKIIVKSSKDNHEIALASWPTKDIKTKEEFNIFIQNCISSNAWGKAQHNLPKKGQEGVSNDSYDDADVLPNSEREEVIEVEHQEPDYEKDENGNVIYDQFPNQENPELSYQQPRQKVDENGNPIFITIPAKTRIIITIRSEYEIIGPIDISNDPEFIIQNAEQESEYDRSVGHKVSIRIQALNKTKSTTFASTLGLEAFSHFKQILEIIEYGWLEQGVLQVQLNRDMIKNYYTDAEIDEILGLLNDGIANRPSNKN